jgi:cytochrome c-type biogenesis protein CcmH
MGLVTLLGLVLVTAAGLWWFGRLRGAALQLAMAALMIGAAGYALQGRPDLPGAPKAAGQRPGPLPLTKPRNALFGQFNAADRWLIIADAYESRGETGDAVKTLRSALRAHPNDPALWVGMGNALVDHAGMLTPAATIAFDRARAAAPNHPGPLFFQGLALARSGQRDAALALWQKALKLTPAQASYRPFIAEGITALSAAPPPPAR